MVTVAFYRNALIEIPRTLHMGVIKIKRDGRHLSRTSHTRVD